MAKDIEWRLVIDDEGSIKKMEQVSKEGKKVDDNLDKTKKTSSGLRGELKNLGGAFGGLKGMIGLASGALGAFGVGFGLQSVISSTKEMATETEKFRTATGMGTQSSLYYTAALKARGLNAGVVTKAYKTLGKSLESAERQNYSFAIGQEKAHAKGRLYTAQLGMQAQAFQELGLSLTSIERMKPERQFQAITEKLEGIKDGLQKTRLATQLFGRGGTALLPVLDKGSLSLNHYRQMAERFFPTLKGGKNVINEMIGAQSESTMAWEGLEFTLGTAVMPALVSVERSFAGVVSEVEKGKGTFGTLEGIFSRLANAAKGAFSFIKSIAGALGVKLSGNTLGAVLASAAAVDAAKHVPGVKPVARSGKVAGKVLKPLGKFTIEHPYVAPFTAAVLAGGYGGLKLSEAYPQGLVAGSPMLRRLLAPSTAELANEALTGSAHPVGSRVGKQGFGNTTLGGKPAHITKEDEQARELIAIRNILQEIRASGGHPTHQEIYLDARKVGEALALNARAMRYVAEGVERNANARNALR